jgi:hypothetical protein
MKIYNEMKTEILENPDLKKGYLKDDKLVVNIIPPQEEVTEEWHYEYKEYENGGKDRIKVIDVAYKPAQPEQYEYEDILIYIAYTEEQIKEQYEELIVSKIRQKYSLNQELAILRQRDTKPTEYQEYFDYVEQCKIEAKSEVVTYG